MSRARLIPAMDAILASDAACALIRTHGQRATRAALRAASEALRADLLAGEVPQVSSAADAGEEVVVRAATALAAAGRSRLQPVLNATGVIVHTNLGRAPLSAASRAALDEVARGYVSLEFDLDSGSRGSRHVHAERLLCEVTGAEAAVVANNTAAALTLALSTLAAGREVVISRGELVEIGGGFRVPDVLRASGALLREVGTTNRTRAADYAAALGDRTAAMLRVHPSNFRIEGFTERPALPELAAIAQRFGIPLIEDQGSGWLGSDLLDTGSLWEDARRVLAREPAVRDSIRAGADLVGFSGDKLLGGPQCGVLVGRRALVDQIRRHPLMRAVRVDKLTYAALEATLDAWRRGAAQVEIPVLRMIAMPAAEVEHRASRLRQQLADAGIATTLREGASTIGGGSLPGETLPTSLLVLADDAHPDALLARLRCATPHVVGRIIDDRVCLDLRTVLPEQDEALTLALLERLR
jgi:L-seryl-tRNA(Ser) seleniumtransferase